MKKALEKGRKEELHKIENYDKAINDKTQVWHLHHRLELTLDGEFAHTSKELGRLGMYKHRPYFELIFLTEHDHKSLHASSEAISQDVRTKWKKSRSKPRPEMKGKHPHNYGKPKSEFGIKFYEHYGMTSKDNLKLYLKENGYWKKHKKCRWE